MKADPQIRARLERAAARVPVDTERALAVVLEGKRRNRSRSFAALAVAAVVTLVAVIVWQQRPTDRGFVQEGDLAGRLLFGRRDGSENRLFTLDFRTGARAQVGAGLGTPTAASWSPDGSKVAFTVERDGGARYALVVMNADGSGATTIVEHPKAEGTLGPDFVAVDWSPDGTRLAYSGRTEFRGRTVTILSADGSGAHVVVGLWTSVSWSPDGTELLMLGNPENASQGPLHLYRMQVNGGGVTQLTDDDITEHSASYSPDGSTIVFARPNLFPDDPNVDIFVMDVDGTNVRRLTDETSFDAVPVWSPDGEWIVFASDRDAAPRDRVINQKGDEGGATSIYAMRPDGTGVRLIIDGDGAVAFPWSWTD